jgi:GxxExxY protein
MSAPVKHEALTERLIRIYFEIYNELGHGFVESVYENAYTLLLTRDGIGFERQKPIKVKFLGQEIGDFKADLIVDSVVILELKAVRALDRTHEKQLINYLRATDMEVGMLFNFGPTSQFKRLVLDNDRKQPRAAAAGQPS